MIAPKAVVAPQAAVPAKPVAVPALTPLKSVEKPVTAAKPAATLPRFVVPMHPGLTDFTAETWFAPALSAIRAMAAVQAKVLDHACAELKASLTEAEALARASSPTEALALQGNAMSRRFEAGSAHIADLAMTARKIGKAA